MCNYQPYATDVAGKNWVEKHWRVLSAHPNKLPLSVNHSPLDWSQTDLGHAYCTDSRRPPVLSRLFHWGSNPKASPAGTEQTLAAEACTSPRCRHWCSQRKPAGHKI